MTRFFIPADQITGEQVVLKGADAHHLSKVLRSKVGDELTVLNGKGEEYRAVLTALQPETVRAELIETVGRQAEAAVRIHLVQGMPKGEKLEWILQKNTELGVAGFQPVMTERSTVRLDPPARAKKLERWSKIIREAAEQSGRQLLPELEPIREWRELLRRPFRPGLVLIPWEGERTRSLRQALTEHQGVPDVLTVLIGPEGGFSLAEVEQAQDLGAVPVTLGPRILRTETAGLAVAAAILYHYGEMGG
ncbi:16S rRNA (uracil1498-N3)-methyltransferase [Hydrogenispora ethanolica]|uniref:Ribosomal RNA small subunit methyltransferase E n=1 Tax=Hydrogenispora ethanolica TaxID=1082276 RepID=A0A4R1REI7_HYDET|nr:16S rRNA (uracil(1498)-N(3))-methyltransferase [Hydrogenispora ethanolica]TCL64286.1 16S rRNA (uracil1498-N3)-methyltransferase [Hydrogenispora ethanolica]